MPALPAGSTTALVITGIGIPPYSARGVKQTLEPIAEATVLRRTINGALDNLSPAQFQKYKSEISCEDQDAPAIDGIWPGLQITVDCVYELSYLTSGGSPQRTVVTGSSRINGNFTYYRPQIIFRIVNFTSEYDEWQASVSWQMQLEEV